MIFPPVYSSTGGVPHRSSHRLEKSWSKNHPERSEHATGVEPAGDHQWWVVFFDTLRLIPLHRPGKGDGIFDALQSADPFDDSFYTQPESAMGHTAISSCIQIEFIPRRIFPLRPQPVFNLFQVMLALRAADNFSMPFRR